MLLALPLGAQAVDMFRPLYFIGGVPQHIIWAR